MRCAKFRIYLVNLSRNEKWYEFCVGVLGNSEDKSKFERVCSAYVRHISFKARAISYQLGQNKAP